MPGGLGGTVGSDLTVLVDANPGGGTGGGGGTFGSTINPNIVVVSDPNPDNPVSPAPDPTVKIPYGVRVPTFVVSPWTKRGKGPSITLDHCSILKTVLACFAGDEKPFLSDRVRASHTFESFLTESEPRMDVEASPTLAKLPITAVPLVLPGASQIVTPPLMRKQMREGPVEFHDLTGRLARMLGR
jgi:hypothetical protein